MVLLSTATLCVWLTVLTSAVAQRNSKEEAICQPFLTSRNTSPLVANLQRDLTVDEDGEFACELVLQDNKLPVQIRVTIHEGLGWLAIRHSQMGQHREHVAARHFRLLAELLPGSVDFSLKASTFLLDPQVSDAPLAMKYLENVLYGPASKDPKRTATDTYLARSMYVRALARAQRFHDAEFELELLLRGFPYDFEAAALMHSPGIHYRQYLYLLARVESAYEAIQQLATNEYAGFVPPCIPATVGMDGEVGITGDVTALAQWAPQSYTRLLSDAEFLGHVERREPFIVRLGSAQNMTAALGWGSQNWLGDAGRAYLQSTVGPSERVLVESRPHPSGDGYDGDGDDADPALAKARFGFGLDSHRKFVPFSELLASDFTNAHGNESYYLNIQQPDAQHPEEVYRTPLHLLKAEIPLPAMLRGFAENVTEVNLWMGAARDGDAQSKLHMDATDNLYVVLEGAKKFTIASPADALKMNTISPTFAVSPDGLSFQFNLRKFSAHMKEKATSAGEVEDATGADGEARNSKRSLDKQQDKARRALLDQLQQQEFAAYEAANFHFSQLDANAPAQQQKSAQCDPESPHFTTFTLQAGDMLYLPTGWFHQVVSKQGRQMAVNYWWRALNWRRAVDFERARSEAVFEQLLA